MPGVPCENRVGGRKMTASADAAQATLVELDGRIDPLASVGNFEDLAPILADDFVYTHSTGQSQNKSEWLQGLAGLAGKRERVSSDIAVEMHDDVAVTRGNLDVIWPDGR